MLLIVGKSSNGLIYGMSRAGEVFGTVTPNYVGNDMVRITSLSIYQTDQIILKFEGGVKVDTATGLNLITAAGAIINFTWDDGVSAYLATDAGLYAKIKANIDGVIEFAPITFTQMSTNPPPAPEPTPDMSWSKHDLIEYANDHGIDITGLHKKADILAAILGA